jgi:ribose-phosphate pyrophosphokinase
MADFIVFTGSANPALTEPIVAELGVRAAAWTIERFADGETHARLDEAVRGREVFVVQPTALPVNDQLVELLAFADACRRSAAGRIMAIVPYFGYARSDKRHSRREPITANLVVRLMQSAGIDQVITLDLHAAQIEGFFQIPVVSLPTVPSTCRALPGRISPESVVVSPDARRVAMATHYAHRLGKPVVVLHKHGTSATETEVTPVVADVRGRPCLIIDDMISTGGTISRAVEALLEAGAQPQITVPATHGLFVGDAPARLLQKAIREIVVTDSVAQTDRLGPTSRVVSPHDCSRRRSVELSLTIRSRTFFKTPRLRCTPPPRLNIVRRQRNANRFPKSRRSRTVACGTPGRVCRPLRCPGPGPTLRRRPGRL